MLPFLFIIQLQRPAKYLTELNWAWFLKQRASLISKGRPVFVTKSQLKPREERVLYSSFIRLDSTWLVE